MASRRTKRRPLGTAQDACANQLCDSTFGLKERLLQYLACPSCAGTIGLTSETREDDEIIEGQLSCASCARSWSITRGVPRFASMDEVEEDKAATAAGFGWQWTHFTQADEKYEQQFLSWIAPVAPEFFKDKVVLEGGCG